MRLRVGQHPSIEEDPTFSVLLHGVKSNHVSLGIEDKSNKTVLADSHLLLLNFSTIFRSAGCLYRTIGADKVNDGSSHTGILAVHLDQRTWTPGIAGLHWECPQFHSGAFQALKRDLKRVLVKGLGSIDVLDINFKPTHNIAICLHILICTFGEYAKSAGKTRVKNAERLRARISSFTAGILDAGDTRMAITLPGRSRKTLTHTN
jgi:hypothetical protein